MSSQELTNPATQFHSHLRDFLAHPREGLPISRPLRGALKELFDARTLPSTLDEWNAWFRTLCRPTNRSEYARSHRYQLAKQFNQLLDHWYASGWIPERWQVQNYQRSRLTNVLHLPALLELSPTALQLLTQEFIHELTTAESYFKQDERWTRAFNNFTFAFIRFGGGAWSSVFSDLAQLRWRHLRMVRDGCLLIPRDGIELRIYVPTLVQFCALILGEALPRLPYQKSPNDDQPILPSSGNINSAQNIQTQRRIFHHWLNELGKRAHLHKLYGSDLKISIQTLAQASVYPFLQIYSPLVVGAMIGKVGYSPVPDEQRNIFESFVSGKDKTIAWQSKHDPKERALLPAPHVEESDDSPESQIAKWIRQLHHACRPLFGKSVQRKAAAKNLIDFSNAILLPFDVFISKTNSDHRHLVGQTEMIPSSVFNLAVTALFLARQCSERTRTANTLAAQRSDLVDLIRELADVRTDEVDEDDVRELLSGDRAAASRRRLESTWKELHMFLKTDLGLEVCEINWRKIKVARERRYVQLLNQTEIDYLLADLEHQQAIHSDEARNQFANVRLATLLALYFGLRVRETVRLTLGDLYLNSQKAFLCVRRSKRGRTRWVYAVAVPSVILRELLAARKRRLEAVQDLSAAFLVRVDGGELSPHEIQDHFTEALARVGLRSEQNAQPLTFHTLRHVFANRLLLAGVPLITIANLMGHVTPETTVGSYLHCLDYLQRQQLRAHMDDASDALWFSFETFGALIGLRRTAVLALSKRYEQTTGKQIAKREVRQIHSAWREGRSDRILLSLSDATNLMIFHLCLEQSEQNQRFICQ